MIAISDTNMPAPLPVDGAISVESNGVPNRKIYYELKNNSKKTGVQFYKPYINNDGKLDYFKLKNYSPNSPIDSVNARGIFYTSGTVSNRLLISLKKLGVKIHANQQFPTYLGGLIQFEGKLRSVFTVIIFLITFIGIFIVDLKTIKERVIRYSFGLTKFTVKETLSPIVVLLLYSLILVLMYIFYLGYGLQTFSTQLFIYLIITDLIIFYVMLLLSQMLMVLLIRLENPVNVIKNKLKGKSVFIFWLFLIAILSISFEKLDVETNQNNIKLTQKMNNLKPWNYLKSWNKLEFFDSSEKNGLAQEVTIKPKLIAEIGAKNYALIKQSGAFVPEFAADSTFKKQLENDGISHPQLNKKLWYLSQHSVVLQSKIYPEQSYNYAKDKAATIFIPKQYKNQVNSLISTVLSEFISFSGYAKKDIAVKYVPNNQKLFVYNENTDQFEGNENIPPLREYGSLKNQIVVALNDPLLLKHGQDNFANFLINNDTIFSPKAVKAISKYNSSLIDGLTNPYQTVALNIKSIQHQLLISQVLRIVLFVSLFTSIIVYILFLYRFNFNTIVKKKILGLSSFRIYSVYVLPLILVNFLTYFITKILFITTGVPLRIFVFSVILTIITTIIFNFLIRNDYAAIIKGSNI
ncbi:hypothetical protein [Leuconostoc pseudomesenteroides]|uniref:hypothetical protein n=1 Tax=Leuconostoc pseudomesenteroides TaxID=33968 RepID=UPI0021A99CA4|nr:hypothetical protein [Leuconostoc pseudomesenteroides]